MILFDSPHVGTTIVNESTAVAVLCYHVKCSSWGNLVFVVIGTYQ